MRINTFTIANKRTTGIFKHKLNLNVKSAFPQKLIVFSGH